jgi:mannitol-1-phosphate 5-dehydrogenase
MKKVIQFGAGKIGRGFLGELFYRSGYETVFVDVDRELISKINLHKTYRIKILKAGVFGKDNIKDSSCLIEVKNITGINAGDVDLVTDALAGVQLAATAVGAGALKPVSSLIALGIEKRACLKVKEPLDIMICENIPYPALTLKNYIFEHLNVEIREYAEKYLGLVESVVSRMVPDITANEGQERGMLIEAEEYGRLPVARNSFKGLIPEIIGMIPHDNLEALVERKLFMHNAGHALCSYWGYQKGYMYVFEAVRDRVVRKKLLAAMEESANALCRKHGFTQAENREYGEDLVRRFDNEGLKDTVERGARDPVRKLGHDERLVGAAKLALEYGIVPRNLALGIAAAIRYDDRRDKIAAGIVKKVEQGGIDLVLKDVCLLNPDGELACLIKESYKELRTLLEIK